MKGPIVTQKNKQENRQLQNKDLAGEHKLGDVGQLLLAFIFTVIWIADTFIFKYTTQLNEYIPNNIRLPAAILFLSASACMAIKGLSVVFGKNKKHTKVIRKNIFSIIRHPIYMSEILLYFGLLLLSISLAALLIWVLTIIFLHYIAKYEEILCIERYGDEYIRYMKDVPMWIPRLWNKGE